MNSLRTSEVRLSQVQGVWHPNPTTSDMNCTEVVVVVAADSDSCCGDEVRLTVVDL